LGSELRDQLLQQNAGFEHALKEFKVPVTLWRQAQTDLLRSQYDSVDDFLKAYAEHGDITKMAVAYHLGLRESLDSHLDPRQTDHWYKSLVTEILSEASLFEEKRLSIVTFNYDLSLEAYLVQTLINRYRWTEEKARAAVESLHITHVYGHLGPVDIVHGKGRRYGTLNEGEALRQISIATCHEVASVKAVTEARRQLSESWNVIFLGFGYSLENLKLLNLRESLSTEASVYASIFMCDFGKVRLTQHLRAGQEVHWYPGANRPDPTRNLIQQMFTEAARRT
jgi:hypothetical protein